MTRFLKLISVFIVLVSFDARAEKWANQFTEFELPANWACSIEDAEWVCQSSDPAKKKEAIIVLAAKLKGDQDSLDQYLSYLKGVKTFTSVTGKPMKSEPKYARSVNLSGHPWVDALHLESEIPGFFTRYLATVKEDIGVLVTYSVSKNKHQDYLADFENLVRTLKVFRKPGGINAAADGGIVRNVHIPTTVTGDTVFPGHNVPGGNDVRQAQPKPKGGMDDTTFYIIVAAAAVGLMIFMKKKRGG